jgi:hypothetical protein
MNGESSDDVPPKLTPIPRSHFSTMFYRTRSKYILEHIQPLASRLDFLLRARIWTLSRAGHWYRDPIYWVDSHHPKAYWCIESPFSSTMKSHTRSKLDMLLLFFQRSWKIIFNLTMFLSFYFHEDTNSVIIQESKREFRCTWFMM